MAKSIISCCLILLSISALESSFVPVSDSFISPVVMDDNMVDEEYPMLSSFELFSITDLLMEITLRPCSFVSRPIMESIKKFLVAGLSRAPQQSNSHAQFYSTYHTLVNCLSRSDETYAKVKSMESPFTSDANLSKAWRTFSSVLRRRRRMAVDNHNDGENELVPKNNHLADHHEFLEELSIIDPNLSFEEFFTVLLSITDQTCNQELGVQLPVEFLVPLLSEVSYWAKAQGSSVYKTAQVKYFHNSHVLDELHKCHRTLKATASASTSTASPTKN